MHLPITTCPINSQSCDEESDCTNCAVYYKALQSAHSTGQNYWVCGFCAVGQKDAWQGATYDELARGLYKAGDCVRCGNYRICLMLVIGQKIKDSLVSEELIDE